MTDIENKIRDAWNEETGADPYVDGLDWERLLPYNSSMRSFRKGYLAAVQIAEKDAEVERLKAVYQQTLSQYDKTWKALGDCAVQLSDITKELTAAREREEKAVTYIDAIEDYRCYRHGSGCPASLSKEKEAAMIQAERAYDASRAEKKEGE